ncbi:MAG: hypothetical protein FJZ04_02410 [Candidatus Moranbacteria bacterium]|nr:hypothetical protein [Candidatus Moranbacteria bacterium]
MPLLKNIITGFSVFSLAFPLPVLAIAGWEVKLWMLSAIMAGLLLLGGLLRKGFNWLGKSKIFWLGVGLTLFSLLGIVNSPEKIYSLKQLAVLAALVVLGIFFEFNVRKFSREIYLGLAIGLLVNSIAAIYQNIAFENGWLHFEIMAARPNAFFPEADWLGMYLALGLVPFLAALANGKNASLPEILKNNYLLYAFSLLAITALIITVARASWLALLVEMGIIIAISVYSNIKTYGLRLTAYGFLKKSAIFTSLIITSLIFINIFNLSRFNIPDRFRSIFFREHVITVAENPNTGESFKINLEEIELYREQGYIVKENYVADENILSRKGRACGAWDIIKEHPILGSGLGATMIATNYEHNANNLFLEWWASAGLGGIVLIIGLIVYQVVKGVQLLKNNSHKATLVIAGTAGFVVVNLFNASIFLAFAWFYLVWLLSITKHRT